MFDIIGKRNIFLIGSGLIVAASLVCVLVFGLKLGIDFAGGTLWQINFKGQPAVSDIKSFFLEQLKQDAAVIRGADGSFLFRLKNISQAEHQQYGDELRNKFGGFEELSFQSLGPSVGEELRKNALIAVFLVLVAISAYIAFAFRKVSRPVSSWKYGAITLITLFHDIAIPTGVFAALGFSFGAEVDTNFVVALLVVLGFSVHDTIVVFDRIRENLVLSGGREDLKAVVNRSINETFARSINTSLTLIIVLTALYLLGPETLRYFILTILIGVTAGTYSSIFVASPLLTLWHDLTARPNKY